jgi:cytochrome d ubiquinol oxidase subunit II
MIASIGPFWDANETWLVLGVGLLLVAFPLAHGIILTHLYLPTAVMLIGLIFRGVAFDFRAKVPAHRKARWNFAFFIGSLLTALAQGYMLGSYIMGFERSLPAFGFALLCAAGVAVWYTLIGACWLIMKTDGALQKKAIHWAKLALVGSALTIALVSLTTPLVSERIFDKWFSLPSLIYLSPIPLVTALLVLWLWSTLSQLPRKNDKLCWLPFVQAVGIMVLCFIGLAYSFFPYIVPEQLLITEAASAPESLFIILIGALVVLPVLIAYTALAYNIFHGKAPHDLHYH